MIKIRSLVRKVKPFNVLKLLFAVVLFFVIFKVIIAYRAQLAYAELQKKLAAEKAARGVSPEIIQRTQGFAERNVDEEDLELVEFVKTLLVAPFPVHLRKLSNKNKTDFSQMGIRKH
jgi:hypothetical protein